MGAVTAFPARRRTGGVRRQPWYGLQPAWTLPLEADARREHGGALRVFVYRGGLVYRVPVGVPGRLQPVQVTINFYERPPYDCYGLPPEEYPRVFACNADPSPHRMPGDGALCLYYPLSEPERRWRPVNGLLALIDLARDHVFFEDHWRATGGPCGGEWLGEEQPHGFPAEGTA